LREYSAKRVFGGGGGIVAENSLSRGPIAASRLSCSCCTKCQKNISTAFSSLSMADLEFDNAFWVNHITGGSTYSSGVKVRVFFATLREALQLELTYSGV
jgi:hypothetical protein